jgi:hypothetical protein
LSDTPKPIHNLFRLGHRRVFVPKEHCRRYEFSTRQNLNLQVGGASDGNELVTLVHLKHWFALDAAKPKFPHPSTKEIVMVFTAAHISPLVALIAGILILIVPQLLNYVVAVYLIVVGLVGLNDIYHFVT